MNAWKCTGETVDKFFDYIRNVQGRELFYNELK